MSPGDWTNIIDPKELRIVWGTKLSSGDDSLGAGSPAWWSAPKSSIPSVPVQEADRAALPRVTDLDPESLHQCIRLACFLISISNTVEG